MMRTLVIVGAFLLCIACSCGQREEASPQVPSWTHWATVNGLSVRIKPDTTVLSPNKPLSVAVELKNVGPNPIVLRNINLNYEWIIITDQTGTPFPSYPNAIPQIAPPAPEHFFRLNPNEVRSGNLVATLESSHAYTSKQWKPRFMKFTYSMIDYDVPPGNVLLHYFRSAAKGEEMLKKEGKWVSFTDEFQGTRWVGEIRSPSVQVELRKE